MAVVSSALRDTFKSRAVSTTRSEVPIWRRRLYRRYAMRFSLIAIALGLASGMVHLAGAYEQARSGVSELLLTKAQMTATQVDTFFENIESNIAWASPLALLPKDEAALGRRSLFLRLIQSQPAVTEICHVDAAGRSDIHLSKTAADGGDCEQLKQEVTSTSGRLTRGRLHFKNGSEPSMAISLPDYGAVPGATLAEINLRGIWDQIIKVKLGKTGYAYIADEDGDIVSHFDASRALGRHNVRLTHIFQRALASKGAEAPDDIDRTPDGRPAAFAYAPIPSLNWTVFVKLPMDEALQPFFASVRTSGVILVAALVSALLATLLLARNLIGPIAELQAGAERLGRGDYGIKVTVRPGDELADLADHFNDMSQQLQARDRALRISEERYALSAAGSQDGLWDWDIAGRVMHYSSRWNKMLRGLDEASTGNLKPWFQAVDAKDRRDLASAIRRHLAGQTEHLRCQYRILDAEGRERWILTRGRAIRDKQARAIRVAGSQTDITALKRALDDLATHRDRLEDLVGQRTREVARVSHYLRSALDASPDGMAIFDLQGSIVIANDAFLTAGFDAGTGEFSTLSGANKVTGVFAGHESFTRELHGGGERWLEVRGEPIAELGFLVRVADISAYKQAEDRLRKALESERAFSEAHRSFVALTSHQFRTPLAIIDSCAQRLRRSRSLKLDELDERTQLIRKAVAQMTGLMDRTLTLANLDEGQLRFAPRESSLRSLLERAVTFQQMIATGHRLSLDLTQLGDTAYFDPLLMEQVAANLLSNAVKFSATGTTIRVRGWNEGACVAFSVNDAGVGIPPDQTDFIFQRFFRGRNAAGLDGSGIGLGLASEIIRLHGGSIEVISREHHGSTFIVRWPQAGGSTTEGGTADAIDLVH